jgi:protein-disulfide isomerase
LRLVVVLVGAIGATAVVAGDDFAVDDARLDPAARAIFQSIADEELCTCDCPSTLGHCLRKETTCRPAVELGHWIVDHLEAGDGRSVAEAAAKETAAFRSKKKPTVVDGYAVKGNPKAAITIVEYADFECGHCKLVVPVVEEFVKKHPDVRVVYKHLPLTAHVMARSAAIAAEAAGRQGKFWEMHSALFATQEILSEELLRSHATAMGLDMKKFEADMKDAALAKKVDDSRSEALALGIAGTPAFAIDGRLFELSRTVSSFETRLRMEAARASASCK